MTIKELEKKIKKAIEDKTFARETYVVPHIMEIIKEYLSSPSQYEPR